MSYVIKKDLTKVNKGAKGANKPEWIIFHFVGASGQAQANANYFKNTYRGASAHYFVDPNNIIQVVEDDTPAWHIGDGSRTRRGTHNGYVKRGYATNNNSIGIEHCQDTSTGKDVWNWGFHKETLKRSEWLIKQLQKKHNIDDDHVIRHYDATTKNCPGNWSNTDWNNFKKRLETGIVQSTPTGGSGSEGKRDEKNMILVEPGDTLSSIAKEHGVSVDNLVSWNDLDDPNLIFPETKLFIKKPTVSSGSFSNIDKLAQEVIAGKHGTGATRKKNLGSNYDAVQKRVNDILIRGKSTPTRDPIQTKGVETLAREVIDGKWGSGDERKRRLGSRYNAVQKRVNQILSGGKNRKSNTKGVETLAREVIDGKWGHGDERKRRLGSRYDAVQKRVNQILSGGNTRRKKSTRKTTSQLVDEVNRGLHGNGAERKKSLGSRYSEVQAEINRRARRG